MDHICFVTLLKCFFPGMGFGLMYLPSIVIVGFYFDKKRALATGIATCGSGIGAFVFAPLCKYLIDLYGWQGAMWIVSAIVLNGLVLGGLYRPLTFDDLELIRQKWRAQKSAQEIIQVERRAKIVDLSNDNGNKVEIKFEDTDLFLGDKQLQDNIQSLRKNILERQHHRKYQTEIKQSDQQLLTVNPELCTSRADFLTSIESLTFSLPSVTPSGYFGGNPPEATTTSLVKDVLANIKDNFDFTVLRNPVFVIYGISCILCMAGE